MVERATHGQHISAQFNAELEAIRNDLLEMGGKVEHQIELAADALINGDSGPADEAIAADRDINRMEMDIDEQCVRIIARRQPAASDLRLVISIAKVATDLERIGDEASRIAQVATQMASQQVTDPVELRSRRVARHVIGMLHQALDAFARLSVDSAVNVVLSDSDINDDYKRGLLELQLAMRNDPDHIDQYMDRIWALRSLERIGDHACNIAEQVVYLVRGVDVRHTDSEGLRQLLN